MNATDSSRRNPREADADWTPIEPLLDEAMHALDDTDRAAVLLRYFENKSLREVGAALPGRGRAVVTTPIRAARSCWS